MPNDYFRFREFTVCQFKSAMKVCTDACLFGAWVAEQADEGIKNILDIGSGTGVLTLMVTQKIPAEADAVEIEEGAYEQSRDNFKMAPWSGRLHIHHIPVQEYRPSTKYNLILSNPPFYKDQLESPEETRNLAMHGGSLSLEDLISKVAELITADGKFAVLLPPSRTAQFEELAAKFGLAIHNKCGVRQTPSHSVFRYMYLLKADAANAKGLIDEIIIRKDDGTYSDRFYELLKDYYLFEK